MVYCPSASSNILASCLQSNLCITGLGTYECYLGWRVSQSAVPTSRARLQQREQVLSLQCRARSAIRSHPSRVKQRSTSLLALFDGNLEGMWKSRSICYLDERDRLPVCHLTSRRGYIANESTLYLRHLILNRTTNASIRFARNCGLQQKSCVTTGIVRPVLVEDLMI